MMKKQAMESRLREALAPNIEDPQETVMHIPARSDCPSVLNRNGVDMERFSEGTGNNFRLRAALSIGGLEGNLSGNSQTAYCILVSGTYR